MKKSSLFQTVLNAIKGIFLVLKTERNFQIEFAALLINVILIFTLSLSKMDAVIIIIVCFSVLVAELFNTSIEKIADFIEPNYNKKIGVIKDIAAGGVLAAAILSLIIGVTIYLPYILKFT